MCITGISEMEERENRTEVIFEEVIAENFSEIDERNQTIDFKNNMCSAIKIHKKLHLSTSQLKTKNNEKILKAAREWKNILSSPKQEGGQLTSYYNQLKPKHNVVTFKVLKESATIEFNTQ